MAIDLFGRLLTVFLLLLLGRFVYAPLRRVPPLECVVFGGFWVGGVIWRRKGFVLFRFTSTGTYLVCSRIRLCYCLTDSLQHKLKVKNRGNPNYWNCSSGTDAHRSNSNHRRFAVDHLTSLGSNSE